MAGSIVGMAARIVDLNGDDGTSEELQPLTLPRGYGYPTSSTDNWKMIWMAMNHRHQRREAYVEYRVILNPARAEAGHAVLAQRRPVRLRPAVHGAWRRARGLHSRADVTRREGQVGG